MGKVVSCTGRFLLPVNGFIKKLDSDETGGKWCCCVNLRQSVIRESRRERFQGDLLASGGEKRFS